MNTEKVDQLIAYMEKVPAKRINMDFWAEKESCGTIACLAGHACLMERKRLDWPSTSWQHTCDVKGNGSIESAAQAILGLSSGQGQMLFYDAAWPSSLQKKLLRAELSNDREAYKRVVIERLRYFRRTGK